MVAEKDTWEYNGTKWRHCPQCGKTIPASWGEHKDCGWKSAFSDMMPKQPTQPVPTIATDDIGVFKECIEDAKKIAEGTDFGPSEIQKIATSLFIKRTR